VARCRVILPWSMLVVVVMLLVVAACGGGGGGGNSSANDESDAAASAAKQLFADKGCAQCHGANGEGDGTNPSTAIMGTHMIIQQFTQRVRNGKGSAMPAFGPDKITDDEIKQLFDWLKAGT